MRLRARRAVNGLLRLAMPDESLDRIETLARIGSSLAGVQFDAASFQPSDLTGDPWTFGYCFGLFDAMAQYARLDQYSDGARMMSNAFGKLVGDEARGLEIFGRAVDLQSDGDFSAGSASGGDDLQAWADDANALPTGLARHLSSRSKQ
jgi:hypothetical protein